MARRTAITATAKFILRLGGMAISATLLISIAGCYTPPEDYESQMPWSTPQDWESSPMMPGLGER